MEKNEKEIKTFVNNKPKIKDRHADDKNSRDYIKKMSLQDTRTWFRMRSRMIVRIKANRSSAFRKAAGTVIQKIMRKIQTTGR